MNKSVTRVINLPIKKIKPNPNQPRKYFDRLSMIELARSVKRNGVVHPVTVRPVEDGFELISGERRVRASVMAGKRTVPAIVLDTDENTSAIFSLLENLQREDLSFFEIAEGYKNLIGKGEKTRGELAFQLGKNTSSVAGKMRLLQLPDKIKKLIRDLRLSERHASALLSLDSEDAQLDCVAKFHEEQMSAPCAERYVDEISERQSNASTISSLNVALKGVVNRAKRGGIEASIRKTEFDEEIEYIISVKK